MEKEEITFQKCVDEICQKHKDNSMLRALSCGKTIGVIAIVDDIDLGYLLAYKSGWQHRLSRHHRALRLVSSRTLQVVSAKTPISAEQTVEMSIEEAKREVEPWYLGCSVSPLFDLHMAVTYPTNALFVYPENHMVPKDERDFTFRLCHRDDIETAIIITKSPVILSDFTEDSIITLARVRREG